MLRQIILGLSICCLGAIACGQPLADHVPSDAVVYLGWGGSQKIAGMDKTHLHAVLQASDAGKLFTEFTPALVAHLSPKNPAMAMNIQTFSSIADCLWKHPFAIYITGIDTVGPDQTIVKMGVLCDAGEDSPQLAKDFQHVVSLMGANAMRFMDVKTDGTLVSLIVDHADANPATLADAPKFKDAMSAVQTNPAAMAYLDVPAALAMVDHAVQEKSPDSTGMWKNIENASGLTRVKALAWTGSFDSADWTTQCFLSLPTESPSAKASLSDTTLKLIPKDASLCSACEFNLSAFLDKIRARLGAVNPEYQSNYDKPLGVASAMTGVNFKTDFANSLGDQWVTFSAPEIAGSTILGTVLVNKLTDPAKEQHALESIEAALNNIIAGQMRHSQFRLATRSEDYEGLTIHYVAAPLVSPSWAIADGNLYVALYPQAVAGAVAFERSKAPSILDNPQFVQMRAALKGEHVSALRFDNIPQILDSSYPTWLMVSHYLGFADLTGVSSPMMLLPPIAAIKKELEPVMSVSYWDQTGWHERARAPFPGATLLAGDPMSIYPIGTAALMTSILLPSLNRARETANRIKCGSNMRQIGQAILLYSNEHNGKFPPDLGTLIMTEEISGSVFICPSVNTPLPAGFSTLSAEDQAAWVDKNSDYIYLGQGGTSSESPDLIVLYEKDADHGGDGMNVLFADGHVDFETLAAAHQQIQQQLTGKK